MANYVYIYIYIHLHTFMATKPEFLVAKKDILVALATISVAILSPGMAIKIIRLGYALQPCKSKGLNWPFFYFSGGLL